MKDSEVTLLFVDLALYSCIGKDGKEDANHIWRGDIINVLEIYHN